MEKKVPKERRRLFGVRDAVVLAGIACLAAGLAMIYVPAAFIAVGAGVIFLGVR
jgi:hypothetical protein